MKSIPILIVVSAITMAACGQKESKENQNLQEENDRLRADADAARKEVREAKDQVQAQSILVGEKDVKVAEIQAALSSAQEQAQESKASLDKANTEKSNLEKVIADLRSDLEAIRTQSGAEADRLRASLRKALNLSSSMSDAEIVKAVENRIDQLGNELKTKDAEIASFKQTIQNQQAKVTELTQQVKELNQQLATGTTKMRDEVAIAPFNGIWVVDQASVEGVPTGCSVMLHVSSKTAIISRAVLCDNGTSQIDSYQPNEYGVRKDLFQGSLGFEVASVAIDSTCGALQSSLQATSKFVFDHSTVAGAERATYMFAVDGTKNLVFQSGASLSALERNKSCETIEARAVNPSNAGNKLMQNAAKLCRGEVETKGCFTSSGFVAVP